MSGQNDPDDEDQGQSGQGQGGQPQSGQAPQGGQAGGQAPAGGQGGQAPAGGQAGGQAPAGGQAGGQAYGQAGAQGPGLADKLQQPVVKDQIIKVVGIFAAIGAGLLLVNFLPSTIADEGLSFTYGGAFVVLGVGPVVAAFLGREFAHLDVEQNTVLAASYLSSVGGYFVMAILGLIGLEMADTPGTTGSTFLAELGDLFLPLIFAALAVGVAGVAATYLERNY